jgi:acetyl-CoA C-acetyltransferase
MTDPVYVVGAYEHPTREAPEKSTAQLHAEVAAGALADAGLSPEAVDGYLTAGAPEADLPPLVMADYLGLSPAFYDTTDPGGSAYVSHVGHAASAIRDGTCDVCLVTLAGRPRSAGQATGAGARELRSPQDSFERVYGVTNLTMYAMAARRHAHEFGTTPAQLAEIRAAASHHAQFNEHARYRDPVTVADVLDSPVVADPLHLLDCCVITDGGGALLVASEDVASTLDADRNVELLGHGEAVGHHDAGRIDVTRTAATDSGERAFAEAGLGPADIEYASIYDSFTITVLEALEDLGFCPKGEGGQFVEGGTLQAPDGRLPFNTDGGGLCSNHPNRGGMTKVIAAVRQLRGEVPDEVRVDPDVALAHGTGGSIATRHGAATLVLGRGSA